MLLRPFAHAAEASAWLRRSAAAVLAVFGLMQLVGAASGGIDPLQPLAHLAASGANSKTAPAFMPIRNSGELDAALQTAGRPVMLDFYADWCVSCKEMEAFTFTDAKVRARLDGMLLLQVDVTANSEADRALLKRFSLFGPPGIVFFDPQGREIKGLRVIGYQNAERFLKTLSLATAP
jgi:thioredoxin:protein disulfide reductase